MIHDLDKDIRIDSFVRECALTLIVARDRIPNRVAQFRLQDDGLNRALHRRTSEITMTAVDKSPRSSMSFNRKFLIGYVVINLILIVAGYLQMHGQEPPLTNDQDRVSHAMTLYFWPVISLLMTGLVTAGVYAVRSLCFMGAWLYRWVV